MISCIFDASTKTKNKMIKTRELYIGAKVKFEGEVVEVVLLGQSVVGVENRNGGFVSTVSALVDPILLTDHYFEEIMLGNGDEVSDYFRIEERSHSVGGYVVYDVMNGAVVTTVNYVHEFEKLIDVVLGEAVVERDYYLFD